MPDSIETQQALVSQYKQLPWYKKGGFWLFAPRLAFGLFGYKQTPDDIQINRLGQAAQAACCFKTPFEKLVCRIIVPPRNIQSNYDRPPNAKQAALGRCADVIGVIASFVAERNYRAVSQFHRIADTTSKQKITHQLLKAVVYGMESKEANIPMKQEDARALFRVDLYAKDLLLHSPEFLLERAKVTDWNGRTYTGRNSNAYPKDEGVTAFECAWYLQDFKMIKMMLSCLPASPEGDRIRAELFKQYKQMIAPVDAGGGLTYTHTYYVRPKLAELRIPRGKMLAVTEARTENQVDWSSMCANYKEFEKHLKQRTLLENNAYWIMTIGTLQRFFFPVHVLQRFADPHTPFYPRPQFNGAFKRATVFFHVNRKEISFFGSSLASDCALTRASFRQCIGGELDQIGMSPKWILLAIQQDLAALNKLATDTSTEMQKMMQHLAQSVPTDVLDPDPISTVEASDVLEMSPFTLSIQA